MKIYSYVITHDTGFAPNPFGQAMTLACCKPKIRQTAQIGDMIMATGSKSTIGQNKLVYLMEVTEKKTFAEYFHDPRFQDKIPANRDDSGDNIYNPLANNEYKQLPSRHSRANGDEYQPLKKRDLSSPFVLISNKFTYYGANAISIPTKFTYLIKKGPSHKCNFSDEELQSAQNWFRELDFPRFMVENPQRTKTDSKSC